MRLDIGLGYETQVWNSQPFSVLHGPAAFVGLAKKTGLFRPGLWMSGELRLAGTIEKEGLPISARLEQWALRLLLVADRSLSSRWIVRGGLGGGVDLVHFSSSAILTVPGATVHPNEDFIVVPMLRCLALAKYAFTTKSEFFFGLAADLDLSSTEYVITRAGVRESVFDPLPLRPMALIGVASDVLAY